MIGNIRLTYGETLHFLKNLVLEGAKVDFAPPPLQVTGRGSDKHHALLQNSSAHDLNDMETMNLFNRSNQRY